MAKAPSYARLISVGRSPSGGVPGERVDFYGWLAAAILGWSRCKVHCEEFCVAAEEMTRTPEIVQRLHQDIPYNGDQRSVIVLDLSLNPYHLISDEFLRNIGDITRRWLDSRSRQRVAILLPGAGLPGRASLFWDHLSVSTPAMFAERLVVIANNGAMWPEHPSKDALRDEYIRRRGRDREWLKKQLDLRIIRRLGHYPFDGRGGEHCARYFFDAEHAVHEIGDLIVDWVRTSFGFSGSAHEPMTLLSHGKQSPWFHDAVAGAAAVLGTKFVRLPDTGTPPDVRALDLSGRVVPIFNVVHSGDTFRRVVQWLVDAGVQVSPGALTVLVSNDDVHTEAAGTKLTSLSAPKNRERVPRQECPQCRLRLPFTPVGKEPTMGIRAFDMWSMFLEVKWRAETYGATSSQFYKRLPDMGELFQEYGDWIAYRVHRMLQMIGVHEEAAFICPDESNIAVLVERLGILLQNRQVTVRVPRSAIRSRPPLRPGGGRPGDSNWRRQLNHLENQHVRNIVIIDEIAGSKSTGKALARLLEDFSLKPLAFIPVVDLSPAVRIPGVPTYPLYRIPHPRGNR